MEAAPERVDRLRENFTESFITSLRYARHSQQMKIILFRNFLFSLVISIVPALLPVIALKEMYLSAAQLGLVFTCVGVGSLVGAVFALPTSGLESRRMRSLRSRWRYWPGC